MDDMFGMMINNSLSPERKLVAAITAGLPDTVQQLIKDEGLPLVNAILQQQNGRAALHIACQTGRHTYIDWFIAAGADPNQEDFFGMTPLELALRSGHELCVREMLSVSGDLNPATLWTAQTRAGALSWQTFGEAVITQLIIATPNLSKYREISRILGREYFRYPQKNELFIRAFLLTGNRLQEDDAAEVILFSVMSARNCCIKLFQHSTYSIAFTFQSTALLVY